MRKLAHLLPMSSGCPWQELPFDGPAHSVCVLRCEDARSPLGWDATASRRNGAQPPPIPEPRRTGGGALIAEVCPAAPPGVPLAALCSPASAGDAVVDARTVACRQLQGVNNPVAKPPIGLGLRRRQGLPAREAAAFLFCGWIKVVSQEQVPGNKQSPESNGRR